MVNLTILDFPEYGCRYAPHLMGKRKEKRKRVAPLYVGIAPLNLCKLTTTSANRRYNMCKSVHQNAAHFNLIRSAMFSLPLEAARVLYKCILAVFATSARRAQKAASNVGADVSSATDLSKDEYLAVLGTLSNQWERAEKKSRTAFHNLRCLDEASILGKLRAAAPRYAAGSFDHAIASIDGAEGERGEEPPLDSAVKHANEAVETYQRPTDTEGVPTAPMSPTTSPSTPAEIMNYCGNF